MGKILKILYCSSEVTPFSKTGGLADVSGSLPKALAEAGCDIRIITPKYAGVTDTNQKLNTLIESIEVRVGDRIEKGGLYESRLPDSDVPVYFVSNEGYFIRKGLYGEAGEDYEDNIERFSFFSMAVLYSVYHLGWKPDVIHCNDWQTALIPLYLKTPIKDADLLQDYYKQSGTLFTIHNLGYQGMFSKEEFPALGLAKSIFSINGIEYYGKINLLKGGIVFSDILNTVSPAYSREIQTIENGYGLDGVLKERKDDIYGILNGVDYNEWTPSKDPHLVTNYSVKTISRKKTCKKDLQKHCGLPQEELPVLGMVSRLDVQKGFDILLSIMDELMQLDIQMIILGAGNPKYEERLQEYAAKYPSKLAVNLLFDITLAHKIEAGADLFLIPSKYEPCGLNQLYSFKYGTVPVAHKTGGLADTITDYLPSNIVAERCTGFLFNHYSGEDFLKAVLLAITVYNNKTQWKGIVSAGMNSDFSWKRSAGEYVKLYEKVLDKIKN